MAGTPATSFSNSIAWGKVKVRKNPHIATTAEAAKQTTAQIKMELLDDVLASGERVS